MKSLVLLVIAIFMVFAIINIVHAEPEANPEADADTVAALKELIELAKKGLERIG
uniref:Venom peptide n=1 Tax=Dasymutilla occidentalis TaxID=374947 RepID=A0A8T9VQK3_DASOC|nr:venom peptide precursor [Dasymutilla occidentalis]UOY17161.1 venom peptide precursor [Dasymutilla occidentalis]